MRVAGAARENVGPVACTCRCARIAPRIISQSCIINNRHSRDAILLFSASTSIAISIPTTQHDATIRVPCVPSDTPTWRPRPPRRRASFDAIAREGRDHRVRNASRLCADTVAPSVTPTAPESPPGSVGVH